MTKKIFCLLVVLTFALTSIACAKKVEKKSLKLDKLICTPGLFIRHTWTPNKMR